MSAKLRLRGSTSGYSEITAPAVAGDQTFTLPGTGGEFIVSNTNGDVDLGPLTIDGAASDGSVNLDSSGRLLVGTSSPSTATLKFEVAANVGPDPAFRFNQTATSGLSYDMFFSKTGYAPDDNSSRFLTCSDTTTDRLIIFSDGDVKNHDNSYGQLSDERIKQDIIDANSQWEDLKQVRVRNFKFISDVEQYGNKATSMIGVIAQELEEVSPGLVDENGQPDGSTIKGVKYSVLYMKAVKALQEAMERIETLEAKVAALEVQ